MEEEIDRGVPVASLSGRTVQLNALVVLRDDQGERHPPHHRQLIRMRHRDGLHRPLPHLCAPRCKGESTTERLNLL